MIAAADTFRAAAVQQVKVCGERTGVEVIANESKNADPDEYQQAIKTFLNSLD